MMFALFTSINNPFSSIQFFFFLQLMRAENASMKIHSEMCSMLSAADQRKMNGINKS